MFNHVNIGPSQTNLTSSEREYAFCKSLCAMLVIAAAIWAHTAEASQSGRFTIADDIALTFFGDDTFTDPINFSPDNAVFVVDVDRGRIDLNRCESTLRFYRTADVRKFLSAPNPTSEPSPFWIVSKSTYPDGPIITDVRWLRDSSAVVFLAKTEDGHQQLLLADLQSQTVTELTARDQEVTGFDVRGRDQFVYTILSSLAFRKNDADPKPTVVVATGQPLNDFLFPKESEFFGADLSELWANIDGKRFRVNDPGTGRPIAIHQEGQWALALSPDAQSVTTVLAVQNIPSLWETLYPTARAAGRKIKAGTQDPNQIRGDLISEYVRIDLATGKATALTNAPLGLATGWFGTPRADWSSDGRQVVLANTFLAGGIDSQRLTKNAPCVAVLNLNDNAAQCLIFIQEEGLQGYSPNSQYVDNVRFVWVQNSEFQMIEVVYFENRARKVALFERSADASWRQAKPSEVEPRDVQVSIEQGLNEPPLLVAANSTTGNRQVIWNPNPELKNIRLAHVSTFRWKADDREWEGQLYEPPDFVEGKGYPLVIQTHGIRPGFSPSGAYTTAFAAQELASVGILVLQVRDCGLRVTPDEGFCQVAGYESAVEQLTKHGKVDPNRVGIIGFSRTCYYVLEALTTSHLKFKAASITDGVNYGYLQYIVSSYSTGDMLGLPGEAETIIGARPFGEGLQQWSKRSPLFNMDKVYTPLAVDSTTEAVVYNWEPYATLWYLGKPVELRVINSKEHVFTNPAVRLASQGHTVDWFRFWLKDERDSDPAKAEQYKRWDHLKQLQQQEAQ